MNISPVQVHTLQRILERMYEIAEYRGAGTDTLESTNRAELTALLRQLGVDGGRTAHPIFTNRPADQPTGNGE